MTDDNSNRHDGVPHPLHYRKKEEPTTKAHAVGGLMSGMLVSIILVGAVGLFADLPSHPDPSNPPPPSISLLSRLFAAIFLALAIAAFAFTRHVWRHKRRARWFLTGLLLGGGLMCLVAGACFA